MPNLSESTLSKEGEIATPCCVSSADRRILRDFGAQVAELAARPIEAEKRELWYRLNALEPTRPLIACRIAASCLDEIITPADLRCEGELAREWELRLRKEIFLGTQVRDDQVIEASFILPYLFTNSGWGLDYTKIGGGDGGSYTWDAPIKDYETDLPRLHFPVITVDYQATQRMIDLATDVFGDILVVQLKGTWWWSLGMTMALVELRGLNQIMLDMIEDPDGLHRFMAILRDGHLATLDFLEANGLLSLNNGNTYISSGFSRELPQPDFAGRVRAEDMWGFAESQETVGVSPAMFEEFIFPYQLALLKRFGLVSYGCCEPLDNRWHVVERFPRLRRVGVPPWSSVPGMAEKLGTRHVFSWRPCPSDLGTATFDEAGIRRYIRDGLRASRNCRVEVVLKDLHTVQRDPRRIVRWARIVGEEINALH
ncbi:MAG: hypothetical protein HYY04_07280 [Chloroflexi bacterium]|nr:hypothetical protein [Chloroflexota bacterium]